jgi:hypothetical protein
MATGATGATGYKFMYQGILQDFYEVFHPGNAGITTGFTVANGTDLGTLFAGGDSGITTGYKNLLNNDLGRLFAQLTPFIATNATILGFTNSYYYAIFTDTSVTGIIRPSSNFNYPAGFKLNIICVGGGGGGGGAKSGESCGGGGGGGVYLHSIDYDNSSFNYRVTVGGGGSGGPGTVSGSPGGDSQITYIQIVTKFVIRCKGGGQGTTTAAGSGGQVYLNNNTNTPIAEGNGGNGGDQSAGANCYYNSTGNSLNIPSELITSNPTYISNYYSGGGGGSKSNNNVSYTAGNGGGTLGGGLGGARGYQVNPNNVYPMNGTPGNGYGSGGGSGGYSYYDSDVSYIPPDEPEPDSYFDPNPVPDLGTINIPDDFAISYSGGAGKQGIVIVYAAL